MNLVNNPWIPCIDKNGRACYASLLDCYKNDNIADLAVRPHERVALMRLLLCISYAAVGIPKNERAWEAVANDLRSGVAEYLNKNSDSFELFHPEKPFLQVPNITAVNSKKKDESSWTPCSKLSFTLASGNNSTLFDHAATSERAFSPEWLALNLLTYQMFSPGGTIGAVQWGERQTSRSSSDGPCVSGSMLHTIVRRDTLRASIHANMLTVDELGMYSRRGDGWQGVPIWEYIPDNLDDIKAVRNATATFLGRMVPLTRAVLLSPDGARMLLGTAATLPSFIDGFPQEVTATVVVSKSENKHILLKARTDRAIWRQLGALTVRRIEKQRRGGCIALEHCSEEDDFEIVVCGLVRDQAAVQDSLESCFHIPGAMLNEGGHALFEAEVARAERIAGCLGIAIERYRQLVDGGWNIRLKLAGSGKGALLAMLKSKAMRDYWTAVETNLQLVFTMIRSLGDDSMIELQNSWCNVIKKSALDAYDAACSNDSQRQMRAYVTGRRFLMSRMNRHFITNKDKEAA